MAKQPYRVVASAPKPGSKVRPGRKHYDIIGPDGKRELRYTGTDSEMADEDAARLNEAYAAGARAARAAIALADPEATP